MLPFPDSDPNISKGSEESNYYSLWTATKDLGEMGPGYPMFLELIKQIGVTLLIIAIIYFIPAAIFIYNSYKEIKDSMISSDSPISVFTFGALIFNKHKSVEVKDKTGSITTINQDAILDASL